MASKLNSLLEAVAAFDATALKQIDDAAVAMAFAADVLPSMGSASCRWFWSQLMTGTQLRLTSGAVSATAAQYLLKGGFVLGKDFSSIGEGGLSCLLLSTDARCYLLSQVPMKRHSSFLAFCSDLA